MSTTETVRVWATTNAGNATADSAISSSDSQSPDTVDNNIRSIMVAVKKQANDTGATLVAGGSANALTVTTNQVLETAQLPGTNLKVYALADNTSTTVTFSPDGLAPLNIVRADFTALSVGSIKTNMLLDLNYNSAGWVASNITPVTAGTLASNMALFSARPSGDQAIATGSYTKISFQTEDFDIGSHFDAATNYRWTPPAGYIRLAAYVSVKNVSAGSVVGLKIFKNGTTIVKELTFAMSSAATGSAILAGSIEAFDNPNGTDYYEIFIANSDTAYSVGQVAASFGSGNATWFMGHMI